MLKYFNLECPPASNAENNQGRRVPTIMTERFPNSVPRSKTPLSTELTQSTWPEGRHLFSRVFNRFSSFFSDSFKNLFSVLRVVTDVSIEFTLL